MLACTRCVPIIPPYIDVAVQVWLACVATGALSLAALPFSMKLARWVGAGSILLFAPVSALTVYYIRLLGPEPIFIAVLIATPFPAGLTFAIVAQADSRRLSDPTRCRTCGYQLLGLTTPRCPECGVEFSPSALRPPPNPAADA